MNVTVERRADAPVSAATLARIASTLADQPDLVAAYLFGSRAGGRVSPRSDLDIAVVLAGEPDSRARLSRRLEIMGELEPIAPYAVDVVLLNDAPTALQMEVLRCRRLCERDHAARIAFEARVFAIHADMQPHRDFFTQLMLETAAKGRFGGYGHRHR
ncbi:MAG: nucleotidyltransferase domain-containing protein [Chloroflexi bacterium]|nr:nucleotidyltransferase domain-containing protein [Chloroflexota bacterium]